MVYEPWRLLSLHVRRNSSMKHLQMTQPIARVHEIRNLRQPNFVRAILDRVGDRKAAEALALASFESFFSLILARCAKLAAAPAELNLLGFQASMGFELARAREAAALAPAFPSYVHALGELVCCAAKRAADPA